MKRIAWMLLIFLLLTGCGAQRQEQEAAPEQAPQAAEELPEESAASSAILLPEEDASNGLLPITPAVPDQPGSSNLNPADPPVYERPVETPEYETESVTPGQTDAAGLLPQLAYCFGDTAVDRQGQVLLQLPGYTLEILRDQVTDQPRGIAAREDVTGLVTDFYDLAGQPLLTDLQADSCGCQSDLFWYGRAGDYTLLQISTGQVLESSLADVRTAGTLAVLQPAFWNSRCRLVDGLGQTVAELDRGFRLSGVYTWQGQTYLSVTSKDNRQALVDLEGNSCLGQFYDQVAGITAGCALVRDGGNWLAISLSSGKTTFQWTAPFVLLPGGALAELPTGGFQLVNRQGRQLYQTFSSAWVYYDGDTELIFGQLVRDGAYGTVVLDPGGQELAFLPTELLNVVPVDGETVFYTTASGKSAFELDGMLLKLTDGTTVQVASGAFLTGQVIQTSRGNMVLCVCEDGKQESSVLVQADGSPVLSGISACVYSGGDVLSCAEGLLTLDGQWLYQAKEGAAS